MLIDTVGICCVYFEIGKALVIQIKYMFIIVIHVPIQLWKQLLYYIVTSTYFIAGTVYFNDWYLTAGSGWNQSGSISVLPERIWYPRFKRAWVDTSSSLSEQTQRARGQHEAHLGPVGPSWAPSWPNKRCCQGRLYPIFRRLAKWCACVRSFHIPVAPSSLSKRDSVWKN